LKVEGHLSRGLLTHRRQLALNDNAQRRRQTVLTFCASTSSGIVLHPGWVCYSFWGALLSILTLFNGFCKFVKLWLLWILWMGNYKEPCLGFICEFALSCCVFPCLGLGIYCVAFVGYRNFEIQAAWKEVGVSG